MGTSKFYNALAEINVPETLISNLQRREYMRNLKENQSGTGIDDLTENHKRSMIVDEERPLVFLPKRSNASQETLE